MFNKLFGKKNDGFYLQLEDDNSSPKPEAKAKSKPAADGAKIPTVVAEPPTTTPAAVVALASTTQTALATTSDVKPETETAKAAKKSVKKAEAKKAEATSVPVSAPAPTAPPITNFATDYLIKPSSMSSRRRPGANMNTFMDMARQMQTPVSIKK